jgi:peptide/nickel transport system permease protein
MSAAAIYRTWRRSPPLCIGAVILVLVVTTTILAPLVAPYSATDQNILSRLKPPTAAHWLGTDQFGRDVLSRVLLGGQSSLILGIGAIALALAIGVPLGIAAGYFGGVIDDILMRTTDVFMSFPSLLMALLVITVLGASIEHATVAIGIANTPGIARVVRATTLSVRNEEFVLAARVRGDTVLYTMFGEILPNALPPVIVEGTIRIGFAMLAGAALSYLGLGIQPPQADWGLMMRDARNYIMISPWPLFSPGIALAVTVVGLNLFGDGLSDVLGRKR